MKLPRLFFLTHKDYADFEVLEFGNKRRVIQKDVYDYVMRLLAVLNEREINFHLCPEGWRLWGKVQDFLETNPHIHKYNLIPEYHDYLAHHCECEKCVPATPKCRDCGKLYADFGLDMEFPDEQWDMITDKRGIILCPNCMVKRASKLDRTFVVRATIGFNNPKEIEDA